MASGAPRFHPYAAPSSSTPASASPDAAVVFPPPPSYANSAAAAAAAAATSTATVTAMPTPTVPTVAPAPSAATAAAAAGLKNPKMTLNEWFQKNGYVCGVPYNMTASPLGKGFSCTLTLPIEGAGEMTNISGGGSSKKDAELQCATKALEVITGLGLINSALKPAKKKAKPRPKRPRIGNGSGGDGGGRGGGYYHHPGSMIPPPTFFSYPTAALSTVPAIPPATYSTQPTSASMKLEPEPQSQSQSSASEQPMEASDLTVGDATAAPSTTDVEFDQLKVQLFHCVTINPGKRASVYVMMCPQGELRKRVQAALYALESEGLLAKTSPTSGVNAAPFWHPIGYTGPMGGSLAPDQLGEGRNFPLTELKMVLFDLLVEHPQRTCVELMALSAQAGMPQERKVIQAALYQMEREGHARHTLPPATAQGGPGRKWPTWEAVTEP